ncbi:MAG TPA: acetyl-CoA C-acetyltransferase [Anaerolineae bacterium]|nr:acetyl-CoA C-acetyltransferase [Anaerolineae bacterium]
MAPLTPKSDRDPVIVSAARTPVGKFMSALASLPATRLGALVVQEAVKRASIDPEQIDEVLLGQVVTAGAGQAPARQAAISAGLPDSVGAVTLNKVCGSGLEAVMLAASMIKAGDGDIYVAGGMESMSNAPYLLPEERSGHKYGHTQIIDALQLDGLWCALEDQSMGLAAEFIADQFEVTREEMDEFAYHSHRKAIAAIDAAKFKSEIIPVGIKDAKGRVALIDTDEGPRRDTSLEALAKLKPAFKNDGRVTAGNAPGMNDGAAALVVMSRATADRLSVKPLARIVGYTHAAVPAKWLFIAPARAIPKLLDKINWTLDDFDLIEINEAFAAQVIADARSLEQAGHHWDWNKVNVNGGAVALGHPIGCSGARVLSTLIYALHARGLPRGLATLCLGGGEAVALAIETEK